MKSNADFFKWSPSDQLSWRAKWMQNIGYVLGKDKPMGVPGSSWRHYVDEKCAMVINDSNDPVEAMMTRCYKACRDGEYQSAEEWEKVNMTNENREYWSKIVKKELELIEKYFGSDTQGYEEWKKQYEKYISYAEA